MSRGPGESCYLEVTNTNGILLQMVRSALQIIVGDFGKPRTAHKLMKGKPV